MANDAITLNFTAVEPFAFNFDDLIPKTSPLTHLFVPAQKERYAVSRILKSGPCTHVFWSDGTKTMVRRAPDEPDNDYAAFTAALGIKVFGSNSALKRLIGEKTEHQKPKAKKQPVKQYRPKTFFDLCCDQDRERVNVIDPTDCPNCDAPCESCGADPDIESCPIDFERIERDLAAANSAKTAQEAADAMAHALTGI